MTTDTINTIESAARTAGRRGVAATLVLADGSEFEGEAVGYLPPSGIAVGEVVFNTAMSGYQEIITDPSYAGQIITFTYPHIGNYGTAALDDESGRPHCRGIIVRDYSRRPSNWRSVEDLDDMLVRHRVAAITGIDTRRLTRHIRAHGAMPGAFGTAAPAALLEAARADGGTDGKNLVAHVTTTDAWSEGDPAARHRVVAFDFGIKTSIVRQLVAAGCHVEVVPAGTSAEEVRRRRPDGVFLSNGPGDPSALPEVVATVRELLGTIPMFGICLGHQIMCRAMGAETFKLRFGHHGANHPVRNLASGEVEITSQNHNYAVDPDTLPAHASVSHLNLNDGDVEGVRSDELGCFSVQYHPEAGPGPHDARYLFDEFTALMERRSAGAPARGEGR